MKNFLWIKTVNEQETGEILSRVSNQMIVFLVLEVKIDIFLRRNNSLTSDEIDEETFFTRHDLLTFIWTHTSKSQELNTIFRTRIYFEYRDEGLDGKENIYPDRWLQNRIALLKTSKTSDHFVCSTKATSFPYRSIKRLAHWLYSYKTLKQYIHIGRRLKKPDTSPDSSVSSVHFEVTI